MKVILDAQSIVENRTGIGRYVYNLVKYMQRYNEDDDIIPFYFNFRRKHIGQELFNNNLSGEVNFVPGSIMHRLWKISNIFPMDFFVGKSDLFHFPNYLIKPVKQGKKVITVCDLSFRRFPETLMPSNYRNLKRHFEKSLQEADAIITISNFSKKELYYYYPDIKTPVFVTYLGVDDFMQEMNFEIPCSSTLKKYNLPDEYILHVGTIEPRKNLDFLFRSFAEVKKDYPYLKLVCVGAQGWLNKEVYDEIEKLNIKNDVIFTGFVEDKDLPFIYKCAKLFVFPSKYEGFGIPPLEAMACKVPVLASKIPVLQEILKDAAEFFDLGAAPKEVAVQIKQILSDSDKKKIMIEKGLKNARSYTWKQCANDTFQVYQELL